MLKMPPYISAVEQAFFTPEPEWSDAAEAALEVYRVLKAAKAKLAYCEKEKQNSENIASRWNAIKEWCRQMESVLDKYNPRAWPLCLGELSNKLELLDEANVDFSKDDADPLGGINEGLDEYAGVIIKVLERDMTPQEAEQVYDNRDH